MTLCPRMIRIALSIRSGEDVIATVFTPFDATGEVQRILRDGLRIGQEGIYEG